MKHPIFSRLYSLLFSLLILNTFRSASAVDSRPKENAVVFHCSDKKVIYARIVLTEPGSASLRLSDGRLKTLQQIIAASGIKYADAGERFIFWSKGDTAFITENDKMTYHHCLAH